MNKIERMARAIATLYGDPDELTITSEKPLWMIYKDEAKTVLSVYEPDYASRESAHDV